MIQSITGLSATEREEARRERIGRGILTPVEAAEHLGLTEASLRWYRCKGKGPPAHKQGGRYYYLAHELDAYRAERPL